VERGTAIWAYLSNFSAIGSAILLLPAVLWSLSREQAAVWLLFAPLASMALVVDQALDPTATRYITYAFAGVPRLPRYGELPADATGVIAPSALAAAVGSARRIYGFAAVGHVITLGVIGSLFLHMVVPGGPDHREVLIAWGLFSAGQIVGTRFGYLNAALQGAGRVACSYQASAATRLAMLFGGIAGVLLTRSVVSLGAANLAAALVGRAVAYWHVRRVATLRFTSEGGSEDVTRELFRGSLRLGLAQIGAFMILKANLLIASSSLGLLTAGRYALSMQALDAVTLIAMIPLQYRLPALVGLRARGDVEGFRRSTGAAFVASLSTFLGLATALVVWGPSLLVLVGSKSTFVVVPLFAMMALVTALEMNHAFFGTLLVADNEVPFVKAALGSGLAIVTLSSVLLYGFNGGLWALVLAQFCVQLAYNNWKWPQEACRRFGVRYIDWIRIGILATLPAKRS
jgi:O-antigen/teichoic acid export membrane protein